MRTWRPLQLLALTVFLVAISGCGRQHVTVQSRDLDDKTKIILKDAWLSDHAPKLLQVTFVYEGADPNETYNLRPALRDTRDGRDGPSSWIKQYPTPGKASNQIEVIWEFMSFPKKSDKIYLRLYYSDKRSGRENGQLDFVLPGVSSLPLHKM